MCSLPVLYFESGYLLFLSLCPGILKPHNAVEYRLFLRGVLILAEIAHTHKLEGVAHLRLGKRRLAPALLYRKGIRVYPFGKIQPFAVAVVQKVVIQAEFGGQRIFCAYPVQRALYLSAVGRFAAVAFGVIGAVNGGYITVFIYFVGCVLNVVSAL